KPSNKKPTTNPKRIHHQQLLPKNFGINKHDTLLRSQTTDTYRVSFENHFSISAAAACSLYRVLELQSNRR
ncbi:hypothetical protein, partial [Neomicrococcus aestuarii]|uniref:hypothetical protein n=1 Tax=Neomicrococcus aestuarii TaxID=556325 RepID=UPI0031DF1BCB